MAETGLASSVRKATTLRKGFRRHAAYQAMDVVLADWQAAHERLGRAIAELQALRDERAAQVERGEWPPKLERVDG